jgi:hypothetical protein
MIIVEENEDKTMEETFGFKMMTAAPLRLIGLTPSATKLAMDTITLANPRAASTLQNFGRQ